MMREIIFHAGLPKTGSTSIQRVLYGNRRELANAGIVYPEPDRSDDPKHQFLVTGLLSGRHQALLHAINSTSGEENILFSAEGLSNHLFDFSTESVDVFRKINAPYRCRAVLVTRPWHVWLKSYFKQCVVNPPHERWTQYAFSGSLQEFEKHERVRRFRDIGTLKKRLVEKLGMETVDIIEYSSSVLDDLIAWLPGNVPTDNMKRFPDGANTSLSDVAAEVARQVNGIVHDRAERAMWIGVVAELDGANNIIALSGGGNRRVSATVMDRSVLARLKWDPNCGLDVPRESFGHFVGRLESRLVAVQD